MDPTELARVRLVVRTVAFQGIAVTDTRRASDVDVDVLEEGVKEIVLLRCGERVSLSERGASQTRRVGRTCSSSAICGCVTTGKAFGVLE